MQNANRPASAVGPGVFQALVERTDGDTAQVADAIDAATGFAVALDVVLPPGAMPYQLLPSRVVTSVASLLIAAVVGSAFSLRRVLRVDPASALGSAS